MEPERITITELKKKLERGEPIFFIDTRNFHDWGTTDIMVKGARRIHYSELGQHLDKLPRDRTIVTYCT